MPIKIVVADDSDVMRSAILNALKDEPRIKIVGEASSFGAAMQMVADMKPDILLLDLRLAEKRDFAPELVKSLLVPVKCTVAFSFSNDDDARDLAERYGAVVLLDKMNLYEEMIPTILKWGHSREPLIQKHRAVGA